MTTVATLSLLEIVSELSPADLAIVDWSDILLKPMTLETAQLASLAPDYFLIKACCEGFKECDDPQAAMILGTRLWRAFEVAETTVERKALADSINSLIPINPDLRAVGESLGMDGRPWILAASRMHFSPCSNSVNPGNSKGVVLVEPVCVSGPSAPLRVTVNVWRSPDSVFVAANLINMTTTPFHDLEVFMMGQRIVLSQLNGYAQHTIRLRHPVDCTGSVAVRCDFTPHQGKRFTERCLSIDF